MIFLNFKMTESVGAMVEIKQRLITQQASAAVTQATILHLMGADNAGMQSMGAIRAKWLTR